MENHLGIGSIIAGFLRKRPWTFQRALRRELISNAGAVFTTSMHAAIVGASFGTPVVVPGVGKTKDAFAVLPNPPRLYGSDDVHLAATISELIGRRENHSTEANRAAVVAAFEQTMRAAGML